MHDILPPKVVHISVLRLLGLFAVATFAVHAAVAVIGAAADD